MVLTFVYYRFLSVKIDFSTTYFSMIDNWCLDVFVWLLNRCVPLLMEMLLEVFLAELVEPRNIFLHFDGSQDFVILLCLHLFLLLSLLHLHKFPNLRFLNHKNLLVRYNH